MVERVGSGSLVEAWDDLIIKKFSIRQRALLERSNERSWVEHEIKIGVALVLR